MCGVFSSFFFAVKQIRAKLTMLTKQEEQITLKLADIMNAKKSGVLRPVGAIESLAGDNKDGVVDITSETRHLKVDNSAVGTSTGDTFTGSTTNASKAIQSVKTTSFTTAGFTSNAGKDTYEPDHTSICI